MLLQEAFKILNLNGGASRTEIRHAYAALSKIYHVETHPEEFARLHEAYKLALSTAENGTAQLSKENLQTSKENLQVSMENLQISKENLQTSTKNLQTSAQPIFHEETKNRPVSDLSETKKLYPSTLDQWEEKKKEENSSNSLTCFLDDLLGRNFSIQDCSEIIQLIYYRCRYDEISLETESMLLRITNAEKGIIDDFEINREIFSLSEEKNFLKIPWKTWKILNWTCIICHPDFYRAQNTLAFLDELYHFLSEETLNLRNGIQQELYFALCMTYDFFSDKKENPPETPEKLLLIKIESLLRLHPEHDEYIKDLKLWSNCKEARRIVVFCQEIYTKFLSADDPVFATNKTNASDLDKAFDSDEISLSETAAKLLLDEEILWKEFIYDQITKFLDIISSDQFPKKQEIFYQFVKEREKFHKLSKIRQYFSRSFLNLLDNHIAENYIYNACYLPLTLRLDRIKNCYFTKKIWKKIVCRPIFFQKFKNWLLPKRNGFFSVPCIMPYDVWKLLRKSFEGSSPFEMDSISYLTTEFYFPEYEKRYQKELLWEADHIEESYLKEILPIPALSQGKLELLQSIEEAVPADIKEIAKIWGNLSFDSSGFDFLTRIARAMTHFNFLLVTQKHEKEAVPGDAFCFLEDEVLLYRKKENLLCRLTHPVFYDLISWKFEAAAFHTLSGKPGYDEDFLNTACRDLYCYRHYAAQKKYDRPLTD